MHVILDERSPRAAGLDRPRLVGWLDSVLREGSNVSVGADLPLLFEESDRVVRRLLVVEGAPAAHAAARCLDVVLPSGTVRAAIIGTVATDPARARAA